VIIDDDQGQSGSRAHDRNGFQDLMGAIGLDQVGIVLVLEVARLQQFLVSEKIEEPRGIRVGSYCA
jgi:DNA invertase Pin-like site-specific DNA recombinase